ncbi:35845_t:CDS:2, partial [Gigaspora margarita]
YLEIELLKKQKLSKVLELVLQKSLVRNMESNEQEFFFYTDGSLQLQKENQIGSLTKMGLGWLQLKLAAIWLVVLLAPSSTKLTIYSNSMVAINVVISINRSLAFSQFIKLENF